jgi:hypothetical protein
MQLVQRARVVDEDAAPDDGIHVEETKLQLQDHLPPSASAQQLQAQLPRVFIERVHARVIPSRAQRYQVRVNEIRGALAKRVEAGKHNPLGGCQEHHPRPSFTLHAI